MSTVDGKLQLVTFQLGEEKYGIDIMDVKEIQRLVEVRSIPNAPAYVEGILNLRGAIIPVINLHERFHFKKAAISEEDRQLGGIVIIRIDKMLLGVMIDRISRVVSVEGNVVQPPPQLVSGIGREFIRGVIKEPEGYLIVLDIHRLFNPAELQRITSIRA